MSIILMTNKITNTNYYHYLVYKKFMDKFHLYKLNFYISKYQLINNVTNIVFYLVMIIVLVINIVNIENI